MEDVYKYQIITKDDDQKSFEAEVNAALELGWNLHGSTQVFSTTNSLAHKVRYAQAMTRPAPIPNRKPATKTKAAVKAKPAAPAATPESGDPAQA